MYKHPTLINPVQIHIVDIVYLSSVDSEVRNVNSDECTLYKITLTNNRPRCEI